MFEFCSLASGSSGNSAALCLGGERLLIDAGLSLKKIEENLRAAGLAPEQINRLLVTHAHSDHARSAGRFARKYRVPVCLSRETFQTLKNIKGEDFSGCRIIFLKEKEKFGRLSLRTYRLPHLGHAPDGQDDAGGTLGFLFAVDNFRMGYFTDLGTMPEQIFRDIHDCDFLFLEANHDVRWEKASRRPAQVIARNLSDFGHLSNEQAARIVQRVVKKDGKTRAVMLAHISRECNSQELIKRALRKALPEPPAAPRVLFAPEGRCSEYLSWQTAG
ncbi:MAG: MBL fold metallo-hydrolase [Candidatus Margulisbacteria bacterium]|jgi:phosphoribosyl 1,2-cyclic phosphodiesterase|nr:MBL fold metallo-hydrolase [Candidatus Margulisiibacteriota bacterium]